MPDTTQTNRSRRKVEPWGIGIAIVLVVFVLLLISFVMFASMQNRDLVETGYYQQGLDYDQRIEELQRAQSSAVLIKLDQATRQLTISFIPDSLSTAMPTGELQLYRPSNAEWDRTFDLNLDANGMQVFNTQELPKGAWTAKVSWTVNDQAYFYEQSLYFP